MSRNGVDGGVGIVQDMTSLDELQMVVVELEFIFSVETFFDFEVDFLLADRQMRPKNLNLADFRVIEKVRLI